MKRVCCIIVALFAFVCSHTTVAQTALSSYFLDGMLYNNKINPAMKAERGYFSLLIGNTSLKTKGNVGISDILYPRGENELTTFMSGSVNADEFLGKLPEKAKLGVNFDETILGVGFRMLGGYTSLGVSLHSSVSLSLPKSLFEFAKKGLQNRSYSITGLNINTMNYAALTLGHSREIFKGFRLGVNAKYLLGLAHADILVDRMNVELGDRRWLVESHARMQAALYCESQATVDEDGIVDGVEVGKPSPTSSGFAVDLGFVYDLDAYVPGLKVSGSVVDLGFINWKYMMHGQSSDTRIEFDGFGEVDYNDVEGTVNTELERLGDDAAKMVEFTYDGTSAVKTGLNTTMYLGAEYNMPFYKPLSVGLLYGHCFSPYESSKWYDVRGFINVSPLKWLELSVNYGYGTYGSTLGWILNFHPAGVNFFIGSDCMITKVTPQFIPVNNMNSHITFGLNLALGKRK